jgi:hypothetical protein
MMAAETLGFSTGREIGRSTIRQRRLTHGHPGSAQRQRL